MQIPLADAIQQLRDELRNAVLEGADKDIIFTPRALCEKTKIGDSHKSRIVIQASHWTGGQHGWGSHIRKICDKV